MAGADLWSGMAQANLLSEFIRGDESIFLHGTRCHAFFVFIVERPNRYVV